MSSKSCSSKSLMVDAEMRPAVLKTKGPVQPQRWPQWQRVSMGAPHNEYASPGKCLRHSFCGPVAQLCLTLCDSMDCSTPGLPDFHHLLEFAQTHTHLIESVTLFNHLILCHPLLLCPQSFPASGSFPISQLLASGSQSIGASASVLPMNIQG